MINLIAKLTKVKIMIKSRAMKIFKILPLPLSLPLDQAEFKIGLSLTVVIFRSI